MSLNIFVTAAVGVASLCAKSHQTSCKENTNEDVTGGAKTLLYIYLFVNGRKIFDGMVQDIS